MAPPSSSLSPSALKSEKRPPSPVAPVKVRIDGSQASLFSRGARLLFGGAPELPAAARARLVQPRVSEAPLQPASQ